MYAVKGNMNTHLCVETSLSFGIPSLYFLKFGFEVEYVMVGTNVSVKYADICVLICRR